MQENIKDIEFLNYIYKNSEMGIIGINDVIKNVSGEFKELLIKQRDEYQNICNLVLSIISSYGKDVKEISLTAKVSSKIYSEMLTIKDNSENKIAKMMMEGTNKGIIALVQKINAYDDSNGKIVSLSNKFHNILTNNVEELKKFL